MTDRRLTPANGRVAALHLRGRVQASRFVEGEMRRVSAAVADLLRAPDGARDRQLLRGTEVRVYDTQDGWSFVQHVCDDYVGYVRDTALGDLQPPTHRVINRATHGYTRADIKSPERGWLSMGSLVAVSGTEGRFADTDAGFVPSRHLAPLDQVGTDPVAIAETLLGTPYLWGGNSSAGIDCSGLVQLACLACGRDCPGDSDLQEQAFAGFRTNEAPRRGDLFFWKEGGHVAWVAGPDSILHANAYHMAVTYEPLTEAIARIAGQGDGPVTLHARL